MPALRQELGIAEQCGECACLAQEILSEALGHTPADGMSDAMSELLTTTSGHNQQDTASNASTRGLFYEAS